VLAAEGQSNEAAEPGGGHAGFPASAVKSKTSWPGSVRVTPAGAFTASERRVKRGTDFMGKRGNMNRRPGLERNFSRGGTPRETDRRETRQPLCGVLRNDGGVARVF
jgi:hypothetical protein